MTTEPIEGYLTIHNPSIHGGFRFHAGTPDEPILIITEQGMTYKGVLIEDAGEAHRAWIEVMQTIYNKQH